MDWLGQTQKIRELFKKYRSVALVILLGIFLLLLPESSTGEESEIQKPDALTQLTLQEELSRLLSSVSGAGEVEVLLTQAEGEKTLYQEEERVTANETSRDTVLVTGSDRGQSGLICQVNPPVYQGAVVLCQGADSPQVKLAMVEAVKAATGLTADRISVLKMK